MFTRGEIGKKLKKQLEKGYNIIDIADWAYTFYSDNLRELSSEMDEVLQYLAIMEEGPEFEFSEDELHLLAEKLMNNEEDPLKEIHPNRTDL